MYFLNTMYENQTISKFDQDFHRDIADIAL